MEAQRGERLSIEVSWVESWWEHGSGFRFGGTKGG